MQFSNLQLCVSSSNSCRFRDNLLATRFGYAPQQVHKQSPPFPSTALVPHTVASPAVFWIKFSDTIEAWLECGVVTKVNKPGDVVLRLGASLLHGSTGILYLQRALGVEYSETRLHCCTAASSMLDEGAWLHAMCSRVYRRVRLSTSCDAVRLHPIDVAVSATSSRDVANGVGIVVYLGSRLLSCRGGLLFHLRARWFKSTETLLYHVNCATFLCAKEADGVLGDAMSTPLDRIP